MDFQEIINKRRAINYFDPHKKVDEFILKEIIEEAAMAPSSFNLQPWKVKIITDSVEKEHLRKIAFDQPKITEAPVILMMLADRKAWEPESKTLNTVFNKNVETGKFNESQKEWFTGVTKGLYGRSNEFELAFACKNTGLFAMSLMYSATNRGLSTHPMDGFDYDAVKEKFNISNRYFITMLIAVGYIDKDITVHPKDWRKSFGEIVIL